MTRPIQRAAVVLLSLALVLPAGVSAQSPSAQSTTSGIEGVTWQVSAVAGAADPAAVAGMGADLLLSDGHAGGFGGCNQYTTTYTLDGSSLTFGTPAATLMACPEPQMSFESVYLGALPQTATYGITDGTLELLDASGTAVVTLTSSGGPGASGAPSSIVGTWTVTQLNNGNQGVETVPAEPVLTVTFLEDGTVQGFGGCNQFGGPYVLGGDTIGIGPLNQTMMSCGDAIDAVEGQLTAALDASTAWSLRGDQLELRDGSGALMVGVVAGTPSGPAAPSTQP